jgi:hypothetical protein
MTVPDMLALGAGLCTKAMNGSMVQIAESLALRYMSSSVS